MISFPLYCKSIKQINCFKRQTANILSSIPSKSFVKAAGRQCSQVIRQDVRREVASQCLRPCVKTEANVCQSPHCFFTRVFRSVGQKCSGWNVGPQKWLGPSVKTAPSICQSPLQISILYLHSLQQNRWVNILSLSLFLWNNRYSFGSPMSLLTREQKKHRKNT